MGSGDMFLQETAASVVIFDLRRFSQLAAGAGPLELGALLGHFYSHAEAIVRGHEGRVVRFAADVVLATWLAREVAHHQVRAAQAVAAARHGRPAFLAHRLPGLPGDLDYTVVATSGPVLAGLIGTDSQRSFDIIGQPVAVAAKLARVANSRGSDHLMTFKVDDPAGVEVEGIELGGQVHRLYRLVDA